MRTRTALAVAAALTLSALTGSAAQAAAPRPQVENWAAPSPAYRVATPTTDLGIRSAAGATDGRALRLRLPARADAGPAQGVGISSVRAFRYGTFSSRLRTADCGDQNGAGVVTGTFTFANDGRDHDGDGITDNDEIDIEFLCAQPEVVYLTIWTDYSETTDAFRAISRTVDLSTGTVISTCRRTSWETGCEQLDERENTPTTVKRIRGFNSATTFRTYGFDWQPDRVTYFTDDDAGRRVVLWDYRGARTTIPDRAAPFMQNVWHSGTWDPVGVSAHAPTTAPVSAYVDSTTVRPAAGR